MPHVRIKGATVEISPASPVDLTAGMATTITITVTAEDGVTTDEYTVNVYRKRADESDDATLSALSLSDGTLSPDFMSDRMEYTARVGNDVDKVTVSYTPTDNAGSVTVNVSITADDPTNGCADDAGDEVDLTAGSNTIISLCVTPEAGASPAANLEVYQITVYRMRSNPSPETDLTTFEITDASSAPTTTKFGTDTVAAGALTLSDGDAPDVGYRVRSVTVNADADVGAAVEIMPEDSDNGMMGHQIVLAAGEETMISVTVTPEDPAADPRTYTANVYRQNVNLSDDATLSALMLSGVALTPEFASDETDYTANVPYSTMQTTVSAMANHLGAQSSIDITPADENVDLATGETSVKVTVTAEDGETEKIYTVTVTRAEEAIDDASLSSLSLSGLTLDPVFDPATRVYTAEAAEALESTTVSAMAMPGATVSGDVDAVSLDVGENTITVTVTAEDGTTMMTYTVMVTILSSDATLASLDLSDIMLDPVFDSATTMYTATVDASVEATTVSAMATHSGATISVTEDVSLNVGDNVINVVVTAEDGTTMMTYTVTVTVEMPTLLDRYDADDSGDIDDEELGNAIIDYVNGDLSPSEMGTVIILYGQ